MLATVQGTMRLAAQPGGRGKGIPTPPPPGQANQWTRLTRCSSLRGRTFVREHCVGGGKSSYQVRGVAASTSLPAAAAPVSAAAPTTALEVVLSFLAAFNRRDMEGMAALLAQDCIYHNLSHAEPYQGRAAAGEMLRALVAGAPTGWQLVVEAHTGGSSGGARNSSRSSSGVGSSGSSSTVAVTWHMQSGGRLVPLSQGLGFYRVNQQGMIEYVREASEQVLKVPSLALPAISAAAPLLQTLVSGPLGFSLFPEAADVPPFDAVASTTTTTTSSSSSSSGLSSGKWGAEQGNSAGAAGTPKPPGGASTPNSSGNSSGAGAAQPQGAPPLQQPPGEGLEGVWIKDPGASDARAYERLLVLMQLSGLQRTTAQQLIEGLELERQGGQLSVRFLTVVPFFKVTETYPLEGPPATMARRDLRPGSQTARASLAPDGSGLTIEVNWGEPNAGGVTERFTLGPGGQQLVVESTVDVAAGQATAVQVYRRQPRWQPRFNWNPFSAAGLLQGSGG